MFIVIVMIIFKIASMVTQSLHLVMELRRRRSMLVDLATGVCTPQPGLLYGRRFFEAAEMPDGRIICTG